MGSTKTTHGSLRCFAVSAKRSFASLRIASGIREEMAPSVDWSCLVASIMTATAVVFELSALVIEYSAWGCPGGWDWAGGSQRSMGHEMNEMKNQQNWRMNLRKASNSGHFLWEITWLQQKWWSWMVILRGYIMNDSTCIDEWPTKHFWSYGGHWFLDWSAK